MSGWGGRREGAGRPPRRLVELVENGSFSWRNTGHRRLLLEDESLLELPEGQLRDKLRRIQAFARRDRMYRSDSAAWARTFEVVVREGPDRWWM